jgi:[ribosomal protein S5]-alanine N-acetyltransferase
MKTLETERMILRPWRMEDLEDFYEYAENPNVGPNAGWEPHKDKEVSLKILQSFIKKDEVRAIFYKENGKVIGSLGVHNDKKREGIRAKMIGYVLSETYWGKGLMTEAVKDVIKHLFEEENIDVISCYHYPFNIQSKRVIEKCGFKYEGTLRLASEIFDKSIYDDVCYSITKGDFFNK